METSILQFLDDAVMEVERSHESSRSSHTAEKDG